MARKHITLSSEDSQRLRDAAVAIEGERPDINARVDRLRAAAEEDSFSGELRRAIHAFPRTHHQFLPALLEQTGIAQTELRSFLLGEGALSSFAIDRLVAVLKLHLQPQSVGTLNDQDQQ